MRKALGIGSLLAVGLALLGSACGGTDSQAQQVVVDGSSTVGPFTERAAREYKIRAPDVDVEVGISRSSQGFERFCEGELDIANASRRID